MGHTRTCAAAGGGGMLLMMEIANDIFRAGNRAEDSIALVHGQGFEVDDDNLFLDNVPALWEKTPAAHNLYAGQSWGWDGIDWRFVVGGNYNEPSFPHNWIPQGKSFLNLFLYFFPMVWFTTVLVAKTSEAVQASGENGSMQPVTFGKMI
jgi:hypothetical protein